MRPETQGQKHIAEECMAQLGNQTNDPLLPIATVLQEPRLYHYLPAEIQESFSATEQTPAVIQRQLLEIFVHLASACHTITTYLPRILVRQVLQERSTSAWLHWMTGSLLFADLSGSTALAERLSALGREGTEIVTDFLNEIFATMIQIIQEYGGDLVAFGGDALLVFFDDDHHPRTAARAALALQKALQGYVRTVPGVGSFPMHLHTGVESGRLAFVSAGLPHARHYSVLGPAVNSVAMAEGLAGADEVVVGPSAWSALADSAAGDTVSPGFVRLRSVEGMESLSGAVAEQPMLDQDMEQAIRALLDDLDLLSPYLPAVLLGRILADPQRPKLEAELRPVTVLFAQVVGLEEPALALMPDLAAQAVHAYVTTMQEAIEQFGGVVNKLDVADEGIKLVAIFGAPVAYEDHADRAAHAALVMQQRLAEVNQHIELLMASAGLASPDGHAEDPGETATGSGAARLRQRIGLNLGTTFAGNVGSAARKEYTVMGDAVNVAARVMSKAAWGEVWCSEGVARVIEERMLCEDRGQIALKGKAVPLQLFHLCRERDSSLAGLVSEKHPLVGRTEQLRWLRTHLNAAFEGNGQAVRVVGDAGIGKSHLVLTLLEEAANRGARIISANCFSYTASIPYAAWAEWLKACCGIRAADETAERSAKLAHKLAELGPGMEEWLPLLGDLIRLDVPDNRLTRGLDPQMRQTRRFELLEQLLLHTAGAPLVVVFEDLHWADPISLDLWRRVAGLVRGHPILLIGIHRPNPMFNSNSEQVLELSELTPDESHQLIRALSGDRPMPRELTELIVSRASGNPLFLAELLRVIHDDPQHQRSAQKGRKRPTTSDRLIEDLPDSLQGLLLSRIDRLDDTSRSVLRVASVIGQRIFFDVLLSIQRFERRTLLRQLDILDDEQITQLERTEPQLVYAFRHALLQEVAYQSILFARRRELHGRIGEYLEQRYADDLDDYYGLLAHHYRHSDRHDKAIEYLLKAGHAARDVFANEEAIRYYSWTLEVLAGDEADPRAWEARDALGDVYATVGRYEDALGMHAAILDAAGITLDAACQAHRKRGNVLEKQGQYAAALEALDHAMAIAESGADGISPLAIPLICADLGLVRQRRGEYDLAIAICERGLAALRIDPRTREDELTEARLHSTLGAIYGMRGDYPRAQHHFERSLAAREAIDDLPGMIVSHNNLGYLWQLQSEYERALTHYRVALDLARKINLRYILAVAGCNVAYALLCLGNYAEAEQHCQEALVLAQELHTLHMVAQSYNTLGIVFYHIGYYERALEAYDSALRLNHELGSAYQEANTRMHIALTLCAQARFVEAQAAADQALEQAEALQASRLKVEALNALAEVAIGQGDFTSALTFAREAAQLGQSIGSKYDTGIALRLLGQATTHQERAASHFEESIALFTAIKDRFELARTWAAYGTALIENNDQTNGQEYLKQAQIAFESLGAFGELRHLAPIVERSV